METKSKESSQSPRTPKKKIQLDRTAASPKGSKRSGKEISKELQYDTALNTAEESRRNWSEYKAKKSKSPVSAAIEIEMPIQIEVPPVSAAMQIEIAPNVEPPLQIQPITCDVELCFSAATSLSIECGHRFCQPHRCLLRDKRARLNERLYVEKADANYCPLCSRKTSFTPLP